MKLSEAREAYYEYSGKASEVGRSLSFAGIAVIWLFKAGDGLSSKIPDPLILPLTLYVYSLAFDLLHYVVGSLVWGAYHRWRETHYKGASSDPEFKAPPAINWPTIAFFWLKLACVVAAYGVLLIYLSKQIA